MKDATEITSADGERPPSYGAWTPEARQREYERLNAAIDAATDRSVREGAAKGIFRQCSIGYHMECSDWAGMDCKCRCHPIVAGAIEAAVERGEIV